MHLVMFSRITSVFIFILATSRELKIKLIVLLILLLVEVNETRFYEHTEVIFIVLYFVEGFNVEWNFSGMEGKDYRTL